VENKPNPPTSELSILEGHPLRLAIYSVTMSGYGCAGRGISKFTIGEFLPVIEIRNSDTIIQHFASAWLRGQYRLWISPWVLWRPIEVLIS